MAKINKKTQSKAYNPVCDGCQPPRKFVFKIEGSFYLPAFWNALAAEQIITGALDRGLDSLAIGRASDTITYIANVFEDK